MKKNEKYYKKLRVKIVDFAFNTGYGDRNTIYHVGENRRVDLEQ